MTSWCGILRFLKISASVVIDEVVRSFFATINKVGVADFSAAPIRAPLIWLFPSQVKAPPAWSTAATNAVLRVVASIVTTPPNDQPIMARRFLSTYGNVRRYSAQIGRAHV